VIVKGKNIMIKVNDKTVIAYTEPEDPGHESRKLGEGLTSDAPNLTRALPHCNIAA
jgi:hypothetical protein